MNTFTTLDCQLLDDDLTLSEISKWLRIMNRPNGWCYDLDLIWILNNLKEQKIMPGSKILDAGAGYGILQFILAARGYHVISLDFSPRQILSRASALFDMSGAGDERLPYEHPYMQIIKYGDKNTPITTSRLFRLFRQSHIKVPSALISYFSFRFMKSRIAKKKLGSIKLLRAPFHQIPIESSSVDCVVSVSAIEHSDLNLLPAGISEFKRVLKPNCEAFVTTSGTLEAKDIFDEETSGWCFTEASLAKRFDATTRDFNPELAVKGIVSSQKIKNRLSPYYFLDKRSVFYKKRFSELPYFPVGINVKKSC